MTLYSTPTPAAPPTVLRSLAIADEWALVRHGVEARLRHLGLRAVTSSATFQELAARLGDERAKRIDLVVMGSVPDISQVNAIQRLSEHPARIIALTEHTSPTALIDLWSAGVHGVVGRNARECELAEAVSAVGNGGRYMASGLLGTVFDRSAPATPQPRTDLTPREREVLRELAAGATNGEISDRLHIGTQTVKTHLNNIYDKLGVRRRSHAVRVALSHGLV